MKLATPLRPAAECHQQQSYPSIDTQGGLLYDGTMCVELPATGDQFGPLMASIPGAVENPLISIIQPFLGLILGFYHCVFPAAFFLFIVLVF